MDVIAAFLLGKLEETIFIRIPKGFEDEGKIAKLNSAIYGLTQASRVFYQTMRSFLVKEMKFRVCKSDACVLVKENIIIGLYVDDIIITGENEVVEDFTEVFGKKYKSRVFDDVQDFIGCELIWNKPYSFNHFPGRFHIRSHPICPPLSLHHGNVKSHFVNKVDSI